MKIVVNGQLVNYVDEGKGKVILSLHGWGANVQTFDMMAADLIKSYRVIRLDFPAFGGSPRPAEDWDIGDYATLVIDFLHKLGVDHVTAVIAHSFGGRVTIKMTGQGLLSIDRIVLIGSGGIKHSSSPRQQAYKVIAKTGKQVMKLPGLNKLQGNMRRRLYETAGAMDYLDAGDSLQAIFVKVINEDLRELAAKITVPTLLLWGDGDQETPLSDARIFHEKIVGSRLVVIPGAGHFTYIDEPQKVMAEIKKFL